MKTDYIPSLGMKEEEINLSSLLVYVGLRVKILVSNCLARFKICQAVHFCINLPLDYRYHRHKRSYYRGPFEELENKLHGTNKVTLLD